MRDRGFEQFVATAQPLLLKALVAAAENDVTHPTVAYEFDAEDVSAYSLRLSAGRDPITCYYKVTMSFDGRTGVYFLSEHCAALRTTLGRFMQENGWTVTSDSLGSKHITLILSKIF